jgi:AcrR family transcriptional regulator
MSRPSRQLDQKLIRAALELIPETGFSGLKLRHVAKRAKVNLGMFAYHFKSKQAFTTKVMSQFYESFYSQLTFEISKADNPLTQLRQAVLTLAKFARDNRKMLLGLAIDIMKAYQPTIQFLESNLNRHIKILLHLLKQCQQQGLISRESPMLLVPFMIGSLAGPTIIAALLEKNKLNPIHENMKKLLLPFVLSDRMLDQRLNLAFTAVQSQSQIGKRGTL